MLEDIAILTGGTVISEERGFTLRKHYLEMLGTAEKYTSTKTTQLLLMVQETKTILNLE